MLGLGGGGGVGWECPEPWLVPCASLGPRLTIAATGEFSRAFISAHVIPSSQHSNITVSLGAVVYDSVAFTLERDFIVPADHQEFVKPTLILNITVGVKYMLGWNESVNMFDFFFFFLSLRTLWHLTWRKILCLAPCWFFYQNYFSAQ